MTSREGRARLPEVSTFKVRMFFAVFLIDATWSLVLICPECSAEFINAISGLSVSLLCILANRWQSHQSRFFQIFSEVVYEVGLKYKTTSKFCDGDVNH